ncbi:MAG: hypothetical protein CR981_01335 [Proteobacteria bacterium]|nr:MAG: hypothetical protein CR981_01335 [Pseudomonadota bacterium]PIE64436.1 MAG: hypothetical protein CSA26_08145 [Desulfobacterales bacterium]
MGSHMNHELEKPETLRAKTVFFLWSNLPRFILLTMVILTIVLGLRIQDKKEQAQAEREAARKQAQPPINAVVMPLSKTTIRDKINLPGIIEPWTRLELASKISGTIEEILVREGDTVNKGDIIARIESTDYRIALERADAVYKQKKADYERDKRVHAQGAIPKAELDARETSMQIAKADLDNARLMYNRCRITAPIDGVIGKLNAKIGLFLGRGDPVASILQIDRLKAVIGIPESDISPVKSLNQVPLTIQALNNHEIIGRRYFVSPSPETAARLYRLELEIENRDHLILPGMFLRAEIIKQKKEDVVAIPFYSIISRNNEQYVFVERDGVVSKRLVETGIMEKWLIEITSGLSSGERLIIEGNRDIEDNQKVNVVKVVKDPGAYTQ